MSAVRREWWRGFFGAETGAAMFKGKTPALTRREADVVLRRTGARPGRRILDLACGQGRHVVEFARRGHDATGLDQSALYVARTRARIRAARLSRRCRVVRGDMRDVGRLFPRGSFDLVTLMFNSFAYFDRRSDDAKVLRGIARVLRPGGALLLNTMNHAGGVWRLKTVPALAGRKDVQFWGELEPRVYHLDRAWYDDRRRMLNGEWTFVNLKDRSVKRFRLRVYNYRPRELDRLLARCGLTVVRRWGVLSGRRFTPRSWHQTVVARARAA